MFLDDIFHGNSHHARQETARHRDADQDSKFSILAGLDNRRHHNRKRQPRQTPRKCQQDHIWQILPVIDFHHEDCIHKQNRKPDQLRAICSKQRGKHCLCLADWNDGCTLSEIPHVRKIPTQRRHSKDTAIQTRHRNQCVILNHRIA